MPAFYSNRPPVGQMPLTPPGSGSGHGYSTMHHPQDSFLAHPALPPPRQDALYDYQQGYVSAVATATLPGYQYAHGNYSSANSLPPITNYYDPTLAPILPPLRVDDRMSFTDDYHRRIQHEQHTRERPQRQAAKEEKATGGVSATLDYDMERMTDFVAEAAQSIFQHTMQCPPSFRKWVLQVLSATRLPSATILLSLHYLSDRVTNHPDSIVINENQIYRLLAVSLILGSKFLDDNTFINRSWSDVTAIKVSELNQLELKWLQLIRYQLHVDPLKADGLQAWIDAWKDYETKLSTKQQLARLSPLDTNLHLHNTIHDRRFSPYPSPYSSAGAQPYVAPVSSRPAQFPQLPYGHADPWSMSSDRSAYEDYYKRQNRYPSLSEYDEMARRATDERARHSGYQYPHTMPTPFYQSPSAYSVWDQPWNAAHRHDCACSACACQQHYRSYHMSSGYASQTAVA